MVKQILFLFLFLLVGNSSTAQQTFNSYELFAGAALLTNHGNAYYTQDSKQKLGGTLGILASRDVSTLFRMKVGLSLDQKGFSAKENGIIDITSGAVVNDEREKHITYLTVSAIPTFQFGGKRKLGTGAGLFYGFRTSAKGTFTRSDQNGNVISKFKGDYKTSTRSYDYGLVFNVSYFVNIGQSGLNLRLQENLGLPEYTDSFGYAIKSGMTCFIVGIVIPNER